MITKNVGESCHSRPRKATAAHAPQAFVPSELRLTTGAGKPLLVGFASGYLLPTLVYYKTFHIVPPPAEEQPSAKPRVAVLPVATPGMLELTAIGLF
jgi:hypothetical protein